MTHTKFSDFLDEYNINIPSDFAKLSPHDRQHFLSRLNGYAERERERVSPDILENIELKTHYHITRHPQLGWQNLPDETFARKLSFFSGRTIMTFPFNEVHHNDDGVQSLLKTLCAAKPFMKEDMLNIFSDTYDGKRINLKKFNKEYGLISANFKTPLLDKQFHENYGNRRNIYLPVFGDVSANDAITIRKENIDRYRNLENKLVSLLNETSNTEDKLLETLREIDSHVLDLNRKFESIKREKNLGKTFALLSMVKIIIEIPTNTTAAILDTLQASAEGAMIINEIMKQNNAIKGDDYYLLWRVDDPEGHK